MHPHKSAIIKNTTNAFIGFLENVKSLFKITCIQNTDAHKKLNPTSTIVGKSGDNITVRKTPRFKYLSKNAKAKIPPAKTTNSLSPNTKQSIAQITPNAAAVTHCTFPQA